jgi:hypothetical protein
MSMTLLEQGTAHTGMLQTQGLTAFDSSRGVLLALLENGPFMRGHEASPTSYRPHPGSACQSLTGVASFF